MYLTSLIKKKKIIKGKPTTVLKNSDNSSINNV